MKKFGLSILLSLAVFSTAFAGPLVNEVVIGTPAAKAAPVLAPTGGATTESLYLCRKSLVDGKVDCQKVSDSKDDTVSAAAPVAVTAENVEKLDWAEVLAVYRAVRTNTATPVVAPGSSGPIDACQNSHGASACCQVVSGQILGGNVVVNCK